MDKMSSAELRHALMAVAMNKKREKIQQKIHEEFTKSLNEWEKVLFDYVNVTLKLSSLTELSEQQKRIGGVRSLLKDSTDIIKSVSDQFNKIWEMIEIALPISTIDDTWIESIMSYDKHLVDIKKSLEPVMIFSPDRDTIETVRTLVSQVTDIQAKLNVLSLKIREQSTEKICTSSTRLEIHREEEEEIIEISSAEEE